MLIFCFVCWIHSLHCVLQEEYNERCFYTVDMRSCHRSNLGRFSALSWVPAKHLESRNLRESKAKVRMMNASEALDKTTATWNSHWRGTCLMPTKRSGNTNHWEIAKYISVLNEGEALGNQRPRGIRWGKTHFEYHRSSWKVELTGNPQWKGVVLRGPL